MQPIEGCKFGLLAPPELKDNGALAGITYIDTFGYGHLRVLIQTGVIDAATSAAPLLQHCDTTDGTYAAITNAALADALADGEDDQLHAIDVDLTTGSTKRYIKCLMTAGNGTTGTYACILGILSRKLTDDHDGLKTDSGLDELVSV